jgi:hypothetical protein
VVCGWRIVYVPIVMRVGCVSILMRALAQPEDTRFELYCFFVRLALCLRRLHNFNGVVEVRAQF